jgi:indolepyruvate ferredoxin oxidoreductase
MHLHTRAALKGKVHLVHHLPPPVIAGKNRAGEPVEGKYAPWMHSAFGILARPKGLHGTAFETRWRDPKEAS